LLLQRWSRRVGSPEFFIRITASSVVGSEKFFNFFRNFDPPFPDKEVGDAGSTQVEFPSNERGLS
jgi:hypothetical protein